MSYADAGFGKQTSSIDLVREFHEKFEQPIEDQPYLEDQKVNDLRVELLSEEVDELYDALEARDPVAVLDALADLQYALDGAFLSLGFHRYKDASVAEVHASNLTKLGPDGRPLKRSDGKVTKGPNYRPPDIQKILRG